VIPLFKENVAKMKKTSCHFSTSLADIDELAYSLEDHGAITPPWAVVFQSVITDLY
jgi:hypothetical protein